MKTNHKTRWHSRGILATAVVLAMALSALAGVLIAAANSTTSLSVYGQYKPGTAIFAVAGYGDRLYYDDGTGVASIVGVSIPTTADPNSPAPRTFTKVGTRNFKADIGWSNSDQAEFYVDKDYIYYGPKASGSGGIEKWAKNADGTFGAYQGRLNLPALNKGKTLGYDALTGTWYAGNSSRAIYSFKVGVDTDWKLQFTYPAYGSGQGSHAGLEFAGGYLWVSDNNVDVIGQWQYTGTGAVNGWSEVARFTYSYPQDLKGLGFGPLGHLWGSAGTQAAKGDLPSLYEIGGGPFRFAPDFTANPESLGEGSVTSFTDATVSWPDAVISLKWDFGGTTGTGTNPNFVYGDNGDFTVSLTATSSSGYERTISRVVPVANVAPSAALVAELATVAEGSPISFTGTASDAGSDDLTFTWNWGDGTSTTVVSYRNNGSSADPSPSPQGVYPFSATNTANHVYGDNGTYTVTLTVTDDDGGSIVKTVNATVNNVAPAASAGGPYSGAEGSPISFTGTASDAGSDDLTFTWNWGDGTSTTVVTYTNNGTGPDPVLSPQGIHPFSATSVVKHAYGDNGTYSATLTVRDDDGGTASRTFSVSVTNVAPVADAGDNIIAREGTSVDISGAFTDAGWLDTHSASIEWGDGTVSSATVNETGTGGTANARHTYSSKGVYTVTLAVNDDDGGSVRDTLTVYIPVGISVSVSPSVLPGTLDGRSIPLQDIPLQDIPLQDIPLQDIPLQDISILSSPLQDIPLQDISIDWSAKLAGTSLQGADLATTTLGDVALAGIPLQDIPLQDIPLQDIPLQDIPLQDIPWESIPLQDIAIQDLFAPQDSLTYTIVVSNFGEVTAEDVAVTHTLPSRFRYLSGSTTGATTTDPTVLDNALTWGLFTIPANSTLTLRFKAIAPWSLGTYYSDVSATASIDIPPALRTAPVTVSDTFEQNDTWDLAQGVSADTWYLSYVSTGSDKDWYKIPVPVTKGSVVTVYLSHLPADYDLVLLGHVTRSPGDVPLQDIPLQDIPLQDIPLQDIPLQDIPLQDIPLQDIPLQDIPLQDIPLQDIPLQDISTGRGTTDEVVRSRVIDQTGFYYIEVFGYNGIHSGEPYFLRVKITSPPAVPVVPRSLPATGAAGALYDPFGPDAQTVIVTNQQRLEQYFGNSAVYGTNGLRSKLEAFAGLESVKGLILPVDSQRTVREAFAAWDADAASVDAANAVAAAVRNTMNDVMKTHPNVQYIVIVGSDEIIPFRRVPDDVYLSNEATYAAKAHLVPSALYYSLLQGYVLTDDYLGAGSAVLWKGKELYLPKYATGRLVETPEEIAVVLDEFSTSGGILTVQTALVTGYDFLTDGASAINDALKAKGIDAAVLINQGWTATDLAGILAGDPGPDLSSINAHANHWAFGPAAGSPFFSKQMLASFSGGELVFSMGCHAGLNVDDSVSQTGDWSLDFPQAFARTATWFVGNTGYGYGDSDIVALSEELMNRFAQALGSADAPSVGQSLVKAKRGYFLNMGGYGPFDAKVLAEATLYGLPMYKVSVGAAVPSPSTPGLTMSITANRLVDFAPAGSMSGGAELRSKTLANGVYYSADGETQFVPYRPVQPQTSLPIAYPGQTAHGAVFKGGMYRDLPGFDPLIGRPANDDYTLPEPQFINDAWYPSKLHSLVSLQTGSGQEQRLVVVPGQFVTTASTPHTIGIERLYTSVVYDVFFSSSRDYVAPVVGRVDMTVTGNAGNYTAHIIVKASDPDSVAVPDDGLVKRVVVAWTYANGDTSWKSASLQYDAVLSAWIGDFAGLVSSDVDVLIQAIDAAGNVGVSANKGWFFTPLPVDAGSDQTVNEGSPVVFHGTAEQPIDSTDSVWDFGDGVNAVGAIEATHTYGDNGVHTAILSVNNDKGGSGWDSLKVTVLNVRPTVNVASTVTVQYAEPLALAGSFTDPGKLDTHTYRWEFNDSVGTTLFTAWGNLNLTVDWLSRMTGYPVPGTYSATLTVTDDDGGEGKGTTTVTITKADTTTTVRSSVNPSVLKQPITLTATVFMAQSGRTLAASPTGTVTFSIGATVLGTGTLTTIGGETTAVLTTEALPAGANEVVARYSGDSVFEGSNGVLVQKVFYRFGGFQQPLPDSQYNSGRTIPVKFHVTDFAGNYVTTAVATVSVNDGLALGIAKNSDGQYSFNVDTSGLPVGPLTITISFDDGNSYSQSVTLN